MSEPLTACRLAALAGTDEAQVLRLAHLRLVGANGAFSTGDAMRVRLVIALEAAGVPAGVLAQAVSAGELSLDFGASLIHEPVMLSSATVGETLAALAMPEGFARRLWLAAGFPGFDAGTVLREDDRELLTLIAQARTIGVSEDSLVRAVRVFGHSLRRIVNVMRDLFRVEVEERLLTQGLSRSDMLIIGAERRAALQQVGFRSVFLLHRRFLEEAVFANVATRIQEILETLGHAPPTSATAPTIAFVDLSGFTRFAEATGDAAAAERAAQLEALAQEAAVQRGGRLVKSLGDGVMLLFEGAAAGIAACLDIVDWVERLGDGEARAGIATGPVVQRDGDVFGTTVNLAARIADHARPGCVLASASTREAASGAGLTFGAPVRAPLKGLSEPVELFEAGRRLKRS
ncbi:adenylate/guanylate cyclase domain-containing protein [Salinarimonas soli]|uniref:Adenylate/guanylate cyclase domain-containing protein n=1 Tax=Salinarimonas soli TaxID=1638099 RepID=A0A5B2V9G0_9HYPH|nr:adenylate/guanylate cyclase domain-containing protein [Salinarimonas soli]KAA2235022.1 adenylate/guanylate cyclase domain-containing protein [Salinarimonas soli]